MGGGDVDLYINMLVSSLAKFSIFISTSARTNETRTNFEVVLAQFHVLKFGE
jgi:hypothetical protein